MNKLIQKFVDDGLFNETVGNAIDEAIQNGESVIIAGHRSAGTRPLMANLMAVAKGSGKDTVQVRKMEDLDATPDYFMTMGVPGAEYEEVVEKALSVPGAALIAIKEPENPVSVIKVLKGIAKKGEVVPKVVNQVECDKEDGVPYVKKFAIFTSTEDGKVKRGQLDF